MAVDLHYKLKAFIRIDLISNDPSIVTSVAIVIYTQKGFVLFSSTPTSAQQIVHLHIDATVLPAHHTVVLFTLWWRRIHNVIY
jgi:hypothetical protein